MGYFLAPSLVKLRDEVNARWSHRDKSSDGWIGDPSHAARTSSHNPKWDAPGKWSGVVRALDIDVDDNDPSSDLRTTVLRAAIGDPRVWYVISNGVIYSATYGWQPRAYTGSNGHYHHVHVSLKETTQAWSDTSTWLGPQPPQWKVKPGPLDVTKVVSQFLAAAGVEGKVVRSNDVGQVQEALNEELNLKLAVDGRVGARTLNAWERWEKRSGVVGRPRVPDRRSLTALAKGRWRLENLPPNWEPKRPSKHPVPAPKVKKARVKRIVTWNVYVGNTPKNVERGIRRIVERHSPEEIFLQEASGDVPLIKELAKELGYRVCVGKRAEPYSSLAGQESQSSLILVSKRVRLWSWIAFKLRRSWIGPKRKIRRPGRTLVAATAGGIRAIVFHGPTGKDGANREAWNEATDRLERAANHPASKVRPLVIGGDNNDKWTDEGRRSMHALASRIGAKLVHAEPKIDYFLVRGVEARARAGTKLGSDHVYVVLDLYW